MFRARLNLIRSSSNHTGLSVRGYIIQRDTPIWTLPSRTQLAVGRLTRSHSPRRGSSLHRLPLELRLRRPLPLHRKLHLHRQPDLKLRLHLQLHLELNLQLPPELEAKRNQPRASKRGSDYCNKRSSESTQICDHVSMLSRRVNNSSFVRNVRPVIIASRFSILGSASLNT